MQSRYRRSSCNANVGSSDHPRCRKISSEEEFLVLFYYETWLLNFQTSLDKFFLWIDQRMSLYKISVKGVLGINSPRLSFYEGITKGRCLYLGAMRKVSRLRSRLYSLVQLKKSFHLKHFCIFILKEGMDYL